MLLTEELGATAAEEVSVQDSREEGSSQRETTVWSPWET